MTRSTIQQSRLPRFPRLALGAGLAAAFALAPLTPLVPTTALTYASADEVCAPGIISRVQGPPPVLEAMDALPGTLPYTGKGVLVAVVDSGVDGTRPQLASAFASGSVSLVSDGERPDGLGDPFGHGTAVAGVIAARPENGSGVTGVAPDASLVSIRVFSSTDDQAMKNGTGPTADRLASGIAEASRLGAQIIVVAMSDDVDTPALRNASTDAVANGALVVASAGNRATTASTEDSPRYPAAYDGVLSVTATTLTGLPTNDSIHGAHIDIAAPGQQVLTTATGAGDCVYQTDAPSSSFATAYVAGVAALLAEAHPDEGPAGWAYRLKATADRPNPDASDDMIGWGRIRPAAALSLRPDSSTRGPASPFADTSSAVVKPAQTTIVRSQTDTQATTTIVIAAVAIGSLIAIIALAAQMKRRRLQLATNDAADAAAAAAARRKADEDDSDDNFDA